MVVQFITPFKIAVIIFSAVMALSAVVFDIAGSGATALLCPECPDAKQELGKSIAYATAGSDDVIGRAIDRMETTDDPSELFVLRQTILIKFFIIAFFWIIIGVISKALMPGQRQDLGTKIVAWIFIPVLVLFIAEMFFTFYALGTIKIPFAGMFKLFTNIGVFFKTGVATL